MRIPEDIDRERFVMIALALVAVLFCVSVVGAWSSLRSRGEARNANAVARAEFVGPIAPEGALVPDTASDTPPALDRAAESAAHIALESPSAMPPPDVGTAIVSTGELARGDTLASALARANVPPNIVHLVTRRTATEFDFRRSQPGHRFRLTQDLDGRVLDFRYWTSPTESIRMALQDERYIVGREQAVLQPRVSRIAGVVNSNLYSAVSELGEAAQLAYDFSDVFAWDVDFSRSVKRGDEFRILYERLYYKDENQNEVYAGPGRILAAHYGGTVGEHTAIYFETEEGRGGYYRPDGSSIEREFLIAPLRYSRISSRYTSARRHPILKITRPHHGIDYVAKSGTPVWAVADGEVIYRGWAGGFGNMVKVRHVDGYVSYYTHLSGFGSGLRVGDLVQQKQVVGFVGMTGLATGPHVCFRVAKDGRYVNPASLRRPSAKPIQESLREDFYAVRDTLLSELDSGPFVATSEAL
jgi:murein DD-endopeptidase MepM/ murein hydrolase activator NlpD